MTLKTASAMIVQAVAENLELGITILILFITVAVVVAYWLEIGNVAPGPRAWPIIGSYSDLSNYGATKVQYYYLELQRRYGNIARMTFGKHTVIMVSGYEDVHDVFVRRRDVKLGRPDHVPGVQRVNKPGGGMFYANDVPWVEARTTMMTGLKAAIANPDHEKHILIETRNLVNELTGTEVVELQPRENLRKASLSVHLHSFFGKRYQRDDELFCECYKILVDVNSNDGNFSPAGTIPLLQYIPSAFKSHQIFVDGYTRLASALQSMLVESKETFNEDKIESIADAYLKEQKENPGAYTFSDENIAACMSHMLVGGVWQIADTLDWTLLYLAAYPDVQEQCAHEIKEICGIEDAKYADLTKFSYTTACMYESQRLANVVPTSVPYHIREDTVINDYDVAKGSIPVAHLASVHLDPGKWTDPETFNPDRFLTVDGKLDKKQSAFVPYGVGLRMCPAYSYAEKTTLQILVNLIKAMEFTCIGQPQYEGEFTMCVHPKSNIAVKQRQ